MQHFSYLLAEIVLALQWSAEVLARQFQLNKLAPTIVVGRKRVVKQKRGFKPVALVV